MFAARQTALRSVAGVRLSTPLLITSSSSQRFLSIRSNEPPLEPSFTEKYKLNEPSRFVPIALGAGAFASLTGIYHFNAESQILGIFILFVGTAYAKGGDALAKTLDEYSDAIYKEQTALENARIVETQLKIDGLKKQLSMEEDIRVIYDAYKETIAFQVDSASKQLQFEIRDKIDRMLSDAVKSGAEREASLQKKLVADLVAKTREKFASKEMGKDAFNNAMKLLKNPKATDASLVQKVMKEQLKVKQDQLKKMQASPVNVSAQMQKAVEEKAKEIIRRYDLGNISYKVPKTFQL